MTLHYVQESNRTTVGSVLALEIFQRADAFLAAGASGLDRPVRWVHAGEIADIARFLSGGEMLLTAGLGVGTSDTAQRQYINSLAEVGVSALAIELAGRAFTELPPAVIHQANERGLPLIGLRREIPFVEASAQVLQQLTDNTVREFARSAEVNRFLTERLLAGADHITLLRDVAKQLGRPLVLESSAHAVQAYYGETEKSRQLLTDWGTHSRSIEIHDPGFTGPDACTSLPVVAQGTTWGWLHMPNTGVDNRLDRLLLEQGASTIAISLLSERVSGARSAHHQGILITRLMLGDISGQGFVGRALRLGKDLRGSRLIIAMVGSLSSSTSELDRVLSTVLADNNIVAVTADVGDAVLTVIGLRGDRSLGLAVRALSDPDRVIGFSKVADPEVLAGAVTQARAAYSARQPCQFFDDLGLLRLLVPLSHGPELVAYVEDQLGALLAHDSTTDQVLLPTLVAFLDCDGNKTDAAKRLFIQRRTLYYRLERMNQVLGVSLEDNEVRLGLQVAIRGLELLRTTPLAAPDLNGRRP